MYKHTFVNESFSFQQIDTIVKLKRFQIKFGTSYASITYVYDNILYSILCIITSTLKVDLYILITYATILFVRKIRNHVLSVNILYMLIKNNMFYIKIHRLSRS
ncbi:unnamed protein product [Chrysodeixis includens]|uniref:Uncharacterized protein n=1 Tax=Chrysodeixis includens TaxID=689277 RepID=A0A9N8KT67_CHRIL|nr:unnamed protein product [Chrysodeixis includens]